jgi:hypothetical protein
VPNPAVEEDLAVAGVAGLERPIARWAGRLLKVHFVGGMAEARGGGRRETRVSSAAGPDPALVGIAVRVSALSLLARHGLRARERAVAIALHRSCVVGFAGAESHSLLNGCRGCGAGERRESTSHCTATVVCIRTTTQPIHLVKKKFQSCIYRMEEREKLMRSCI